MSAAKLASQSCLREPAAASTSSDEPTFTTMRRKEVREGVGGDLDMAWRGLNLPGV